MRLDLDLESIAMLRLVIGRLVHALSTPTAPSGGAAIVATAARWAPQATQSTHCE
jgi:hypothetical protein